MAIYHCSVKIIGRNSGRSSVAAAAYRAGEMLVNQYDGITHDFTRKNWIEFTEIILNEKAPKEYQNRSTLWNAVELSEKSKDAQLCREFEVALPVEFTREEQIEVVEKFVKDNLISSGMIADIAIHNPPQMNDRHQPINVFGTVTRNKEEMEFKNPHAHILCTVRPLNEKGQWEKKTEIEYICKKDGKEKAFTALEFKKAKEDGWEKQYRYYMGRKKVYCTPSEVEGKNLKRVNRTPKTTPFGRKNEVVEYWNSKAAIYEWRKQWERVVNEKFMNIQSEVRIDSRSFKDQGREDEVPTIHMGTAATNLERRANREINEGKTEDEIVHSDIGNINLQIKEYNKFVQNLKIKLKEVSKKAKEFTEEIAKKLEVLRAKLIFGNYEEKVMEKKSNYMKVSMASETERIEKYKVELQKVENANRYSEKEIKNLNNKLKECSPIQIKKKLKIQKQIKEEKGKIQDRIDYMQYIGKMCGFFTINDLEKAIQVQFKKMNDYEDFSKKIQNIKNDRKQIMEEYKSTIQSMREKEKQDMQIGAIEERDDVEKKLKEKIIEKYGEDYDLDMYEQSKKITDQCIKSVDKIKEVIDVKEKKINKLRHH